MSRATRTDALYQFYFGLALLLLSAVPLIAALTNIPQSSRDDSPSSPPRSPPTSRRPSLRGDNELLCGKGDKTPEGQEADAALLILQRGNQAHHVDSVNKALDLWDEVIREHPGTPAWYMAILNTGEALQKLGRHADAIAVLQKLLENTALADRNERYDAGIRDEHVTPLDLHLCMNNDWHDACVQISRCYEAINHLEKAHEYAILSRDKYPHFAICYLGWSIRRDWVDQRIAALKTKLDEEELSRSQNE